MAARAMAGGKDATLVIRIDQGMSARLEESARRDGVTASRWARAVIRVALKERWEISADGHERAQRKHARDLNFLVRVPSRLLVDLDDVAAKAGISRSTWCYVAVSEAFSRGIHVEQD